MIRALQLIAPLIYLPQLNGEMTSLLLPVPQKPSSYRFIITVQTHRFFQSHLTFLLSSRSHALRSQFRSRPHVRRTRIYNLYTIHNDATHYITPRRIWHLLCFLFTRVRLNERRKTYCCHVFVEAAQSSLSCFDSVQNLLRIIVETYLFPPIQLISTNSMLQAYSFIHGKCSY